MNVSPNFRVRMIERPPYTSIFGEPPHNQVSLVQAGEANFLSSANEFSVAFD
jgi:hypothetical protein